LGRCAASLMTHSELGNQPPLTVLVNKVRGNYNWCGPTVSGRLVVEECEGYRAEQWRAKDVVVG
jgi:hypothetical protein